jgi:hypothetical protein
VNEQGVGRTMRGTNRSEGILQKREHLLYSMARLQASKLERTGERAHILVRP